MRTRVRQGLIHGFIVLSFLPVSYHNVVSPADHPFAERVRIFQELKKRVSGTPLLLPAYVLGLSTTWRMYSPSWKYFPWFEWSVRDRQGRWAAVETRNLSPTYVAHRSWLAALLWDCKLGMLQSSMVQTDAYRAAYSRYLCRRTRREQGWVPTALRLVEYDKFIPPVDRRGAWTPQTGPVNRTRQWEFACP